MALTYPQKKLLNICVKDLQIYRVSGFVNSGWNGHEHPGEVIEGGSDFA